jgi:alanyl-tRNA synthetase
MNSVPATKKLYLDDAYTVSFQATLLSCVKRADGRSAAALDQTYFYPTSGGQLADRGIIEGVDVIDVVEDDSGIVWHVLGAEWRPDLLSGAVRCETDWGYRFDHMQQHTGQHVLSRAFIKVAELNTVSFHMGAEVCTIDLEGHEGAREVSMEILDEAESLCNRIIWENREVRVRNVTRDELQEEALRKKLPEGVVDVRLVEVAGFDVIGCCGTHVRRTGELGAIKVLKSERAKGANRVSFTVGRRAYRDYCAKHNILRRLSLQLTTGTDTLGEKIDKLQSDGQQSRKDLQKLRKRLVALEAEALISEAESNEGRRYVTCVLDGYDEGYLRMLASELRGKPNTVGLIGSDDGLVICFASKDIELSFTQSVIEPARSQGGAGGGEGGFATVRLPKGVSVAGFVDKAFKNIKQG